MNETPKSKSGRRIPLALLIWLILFTLIVLVQTAGLVAYIVKHPHDEHIFPLRVFILRFFICGVVGATIPFCLWLFVHWLCCWRNLRRTLIGLAVLATLIAIFYAEEDWRGKRAWENCKRELEAKGMVLDWDKFIPPPVPDDQNFFTASSNILLRFHKAQTPEQSDAAAQLSWLRLPPLGSNSFPVFDTARTNPLVVAELTVLPPAGGTPEFVRTSFIAKLNDPEARGQVRGLLEKTIGRSIHGAAGFQFSEFQLSNLSPTRIFLQADTPPSVADLENLISADSITNLGHLRVEATGDKGIFRVLLTGVRVTAAADYLKWSDQFVPAFDEIREALKRPYAIIPGDYSQPFFEPIPNFVTMRSVAQTLAQRTQCYLLLGQPDKALRELTLMHDMCRILERPPTGKPITLVEAMINVAITGLYVSTIADGFKLHGWQEPQMAALQEQLKKINLSPTVAAAFKMELVGSTHTFETHPAYKLAGLFKLVDLIYGGPSSSAKTKAGACWWLLKNPMYLFLNLAPRGWWYQNLVNCAMIESKSLDGFDLEHDTLSSRIFDEVTHNLNQFLDHKSPFKLLAAIAIPNTAKATQTLAYNQTLVNEAQVVCALEHYHLAHGKYPETLDALVPQFIEKLPHDIIGGQPSQGSGSASQPLHYRRTSDSKFLLYSVGWNETDDGGLSSPQATNGAIDYAKGDWVWKN